MNRNFECISLYMYPTTICKSISGQPHRTFPSLYWVCINCFSSTCIMISFHVTVPLVYIMLWLFKKNKGKIFCTTVPRLVRSLSIAFHDERSCIISFHLTSMHASFTSYHGLSLPEKYMYVYFKWNEEELISIDFSLYNN